MGDIKSPKLIIFKGLLFLFTGVFASGILLLEYPTLHVAFVLAVAIWAFARFYYFAFYVIEHYVDPGFRFAGLSDFALYLLHRRRQSSQAPAVPSPLQTPGQSPDT